MKVSELIKKLQKALQDSLVIFEYNDFQVGSVYLNEEESNGEQVIFAYVSTNTAHPRGL